MVHARRFRVQTSEREQQAVVEGPPGAGPFEVRDRHVDGRRSVAGLYAIADTAGRFAARLDVAGVEGAEHPVGLEVVRIELQRPARLTDGVLGAALTRVECGNLGANLGRGAVGDRRALVGRQRFGELTLRFEMPPAQELEVPCLRRRLLGLR